MKSRRIAASMLCACLAGAFLAGSPALDPGRSVAQAQAREARAPADVQRDFDQFIARFRLALKANDGAAVTEMTRFPYYWDEMRDAAYFRRNLYGKIFTAKIRTCLSRGKAVYDKAPNGEENFTLFCGEDLFLFTRTPAGFRFVENSVSGG